MNTRRRMHRSAIPSLLLAGMLGSCAGSDENKQDQGVAEVSSHQTEVEPSGEVAVVTSRPEFDEAQYAADMHELERKRNEVLRLARRLKVRNAAEPAYARDRAAFERADREYEAMFDALCERWRAYDPTRRGESGE